LSLFFGITAENNFLQLTKNIDDKCQIEDTKMQDLGVLGAPVTGAGRFFILYRQQSITCMPAPTLLPIAAHQHYAKTALHTALPLSLVKQDTEAIKMFLHNTKNIDDKCQIEDTRMQDLLVSRLNIRVRCSLAGQFFILYRQQSIRCMPAPTLLPIAAHQHYAKTALRTVLLLSLDTEAIKNWKWLPKRRMMKLMSFLQDEVQKLSD
ncbi:hypothetical protein ACJX0J_042075, partial [Zea mays]